MNRETARSLTLGAIVVVAIFAGLIGLLSLVTGKSPTGDGSEPIVYRKIDGVSLWLRVYKPRGWTATDRQPCVAWFFGGGWETGDVWQFAKQAAYLADRGLVSITVDYRVRSRHGTTPFDSVEDAIAAMDWIRDHADELGIDPNRIAAGGGSSGGHLAAASAIFPDDPVPGALVIFNPILDMDIPAIRERTGGEKFESLLEISPVDRIASPLPPTLIFHGTGDTIVPIQTSEAFTEKARSLGSADIELIRYPGKSHGFYHHGMNANREFNDTMENVDGFLSRLGWIGK